MDVCPTPFTGAMHERPASPALLRCRCACFLMPPCHAGRLVRTAAVPTTAPPPGVSLQRNACA